MKFNVFGSTNVVVCVEGVEADTQEEAFKRRKLNLVAFIHLPEMAGVISLLE